MKLPHSMTIGLERLLDIGTELVTIADFRPATRYTEQGIL